MWSKQDFFCWAHHHHHKIWKIGVYFNKRKHCNLGSWEDIWDIKHRHINISFLKLTIQKRVGTCFSVFTIIIGKWLHYFQELFGYYLTCKHKVLQHATSCHILLRCREHGVVLIERGQTVAGSSTNLYSSVLRRGEAAESLCQSSSCTTDCNYLAWFWPGLALHYCVPTHCRVPSACCH